MPVEQQMIQQAFKFALDPTPAQQRRFTSHAGGARYAYNWGLSTFASALDAYGAEKAAGVAKPATKLPGHFDLCRLWTIYKDDPANELGWVGENSVGTYQAALRDAHGAWKAFLDSRAGRRKGRRVGRPRFKSRRRSKPSFQVHGTTLKVTDYRHVTLPRIGTVRTCEKTKKLLRRLNRPPVTCPDCKGEGKALKPAKVAAGAEPAWELADCAACKTSGQVPAARIVRGNISKEPSGRWFISLTVELVREIRTGPSRRQRDGGTVGVDFGVRDLATLSTGEVIENPRHLATALDKLRRAQRTLSRAAEGSKGREKARQRVAKLHARVANQRRDALEKATSRLVHAHDLIAVEGWDVQQTMQRGSADVPKRVRRDRNRAMADTGIGMARWQLQHKSHWYGSRLIVADPHEPTGRTCSACATVRDKPVAPADEQFHCPSCGHTADRRMNTARVLHRLAHTSDAPSGGESQNARGGDVRPATPRRDRRSPSKREARPRPSVRGKTGTPDP